MGGVGEVYSETIEKFGESARLKAQFLKNGRLKYLLSSIFAGVFVGLGIVLIFSIGAPIKEAGSPFVKMAMGVSFGIALTLVIFAGSELFTGNNMIMTIGNLEKKVTVMDTLKVWILSFAGNLAGSLLLAYTVAMSGLISNPAAKGFIISVAEAKMTASFGELFLRGILCNMLVCLAIWTSMRAKEDIAKIVLIFWCLFGFIGSGYEHSIANMTLLGMSLFVPHEGTLISWTGFLNNMVPVTLGNIVGGAVIIGAGYWYISSKKEMK